MRKVATAVKKDYAAIAAQKIHKPAQARRRKPRFLVYGRNKKGKTRLCSTAPNVLILDPESGADEEVKSNPDVWPLESWDDVNDAYMFLKGGGKSPVTGEPYEWVAIDGGTRLSNMSLRWVMKDEEERNLERRPGQIGKQDYGRSGEMFKGMLLNMHSLYHIGVIITCQERMVEVTDLGEQDEDADSVAAVFVPDLPKGARSHVNALVDVIGRIYTVEGTFKRKFKKRGTEEYVTREVTGIQRRLWIGPHASYDTGYRSQYVLPSYIPDPTIPTLVRIMREGKVT